MELRIEERETCIEVFIDNILAVIIGVEYKERPLESNTISCKTEDMVEVLCSINELSVKFVKYGSLFDVIRLNSFDLKFTSISITRGDLLRAYAIHSFSNSISPYIGWNLYKGS